MANETLLVISAMGVPPYSARGLTQTLEPIEQAAQLRRNVNGSLRDVSAAQFHKYRSVVSCTDQQSPALDNVMPGTQVTVDCVSELSYAAGGSASRTIVSGSQRSESGFVFYRPRLAMMVTNFTQQTDEYGAAVGWTLELEEV